MLSVQYIFTTFFLVRTVYFIQTAIVFFYVLGFILPNVSFQKFVPFCIQPWFSIYLLFGTFLFQNILFFFFFTEISCVIYTDTGLVCITYHSEVPITYLSLDFWQGCLFLLILPYIIHHLCHC